MSTELVLTSDSLDLFRRIVSDLGNWSGLTPCFNHITFKNRGNLTDLKRKKLVTTWYDDGEEWIKVREEGTAYAQKLGWLDAEGNETEYLWSLKG